MKIYYPGNKQVFADVNGFTIQTDQQARSGGDGLYPEPFTLFLASLGTCAGIYVKQFCDQRNIDASTFHLSEQIQYDAAKRMIGKVIIEIHVTPDFPEKYDSAVIRAASQCAVKRHLHPDIELETKVIRKA